MTSANTRHLSLSRDVVLLETASDVQEVVHLRLARGARRIARGRASRRISTSAVWTPAERRTSRFEPTTSPSIPCPSGRSSLYTSVSSWSHLPDRESVLPQLVATLRPVGGCSPKTSTVGRHEGVRRSRFRRRRRPQPHRRRHPGAPVSARGRICPPSKHSAAGSRSASTLVARAADGTTTSIRPDRFA
jgi:hypothetical protein